MNQVFCLCGPQETPRQWNECHTDIEESAGCLVYVNLRFFIKNEKRNNRWGNSGYSSVKGELFRNILGNYLLSLSTEQS